MKLGLMRKNKKGLSEAISFLLITLLVAIVALLSYSFASNFLNSEISILDRNKMEANLKKIDIKINELDDFQGELDYIAINFKEGELLFENNQVRYNSLANYESDETYCIKNICYESINSFESIYFNLTPPYTFKNNIFLAPSQYIIVFENLKNESKIKISLE
jgi:hypothetical protein